MNNSHGDSTNQTNWLNSYSEILRYKLFDMLFIGNNQDISYLICFSWAIIKIFPPNKNISNNWIHILGITFLDHDQIFLDSKNLHPKMGEEMPKWGLN